MTKDEAHNMSQEKIFLHMEARLAKALEETKKKYGEEAADVVAAIIDATMRGLVTNVSELPCPVHVALCAWIETVARWNEQIDELVRK
jgi:phosphoribosyl-ATP pyrophosphohydrolase